MDRVKKERRVRNSICIGVEGERQDENTYLDNADGEEFLALELGYTSSAELPTQGSRK